MEELARELLRRNGYRIVEAIVWVKKTTKGNLFRGQGHYAQHGYEKCIMGVKGTGSSLIHKGKVLNVIEEPVSGNTRKPRAIYELIEKAVPNATYLDIFARDNNMRSGWTSVGLDLVKAQAGDSPQG